MSFAQFGNDLYTGRRSFDFVGRLRRWMVISVVLVAVVAAGLAARGGLSLGIEFTGGSDFRVSGVDNTEGYAERAQRVVQETAGVPDANSTLVGGDAVRVQTEQFDDRETRDVAGALAQEFGVPAQDVSASVVGPSWGASVSRQALLALAWFLVLVSVVLALYFRTWKMSFAALVALAHDMLLTVGVYAIAGFEVTPASMIGFLTILGYSLYDTVVVFDKVRENTTETMQTADRTYSEAANLAVNQTLVRSINTSVVALLPVAAILIMGLTVIGPGTLLDLALALFVGIAVGTYSSIFIATPLLAWLREKEPVMKRLRERVMARRDPADTVGPSGPVRDLQEPPPVGVGSTAAEADGEVSLAAAGVLGGAGRGFVSAPSDHLEHVADEETDADEDEDEDEQGRVTGRGARGPARPTERTATGRPLHPSMRQGDTGPAPRRPRRSKR